MTRIIRGVMVEGEGFADMGYCLLEDGTVAVMQRHYAMKPEDARAVCELIEKNFPAAGNGGEKAQMVREV